MPITIAKNSMQSTKPKTSKSKTSKSKINDWSFPPDTVEFLRELKINNNREWFTENKTRYELMVKQPATDFCDHMVVALEKLTGQPHSSKVFRVHRDVRFSKDKTPYKTYLHMLFRPTDQDSGPKWFFGLEPDKLVLGTGIFGFEKGALEAYRRRVIGADGRALAGQLDKMRKAGMRIRDPELKRVPAGFPADLPQSELLRHKGLSAWADHPGGPAAACSPDILATSIKGFKDLKPLFDWLNDLPE